MTKLWDPESSEWRRDAADIAFGFAPTIYPCKTCKGPVASGYVCNYCREGDPYEPRDDWSEVRDGDA